MNNKCPQNCFDMDPASQLIAGSLNSRKSTFDYFEFSTPRTAFTALQNQTLSLQMYSDSYFVSKELVANSTGTFNVRIFNGGTGRTFMNSRINNLNLFGTIQLPNRLKDPIIIPPSSLVGMDITDLSGSTNNIQLTLSGYRWFDLSKMPGQVKAGSRLQWFQYGVDQTLSANGQANSIIRIDSDSDFLVRKIVGTSTGIYNVQISDASSADVWQDQFVINTNVVGTAQYPNILSKPKLMRANSSFSINLKDLTGATNTVQLVLEGSKVYK